ncbi:MAG: hypothetical protein IJE44_05250 [Clostridia bacterium]|nr:hypothetical protein [Clostridia bacterium]
MSGNFYDFDKDEIFSEIYINKPKKKPIQKEYEIEIPAPRKIVATPVDSPMPSSRAPQRRPKKARKKMSSTAIAFSIMGIAISCVLVFVFSTLAVIFGWKYIPKFDKNEKSVVESVEKIDEYINVSDDGNSVEVVPYYRETEGDDAPPTQKAEEETSEEETSEETSNSDVEVINID